MLAWGKRVSPEFRAKVVDICASLGADPNHLMACMAFESAETFDPSVRSGAGSGAVGLIQFMPSTAQALGTSTEDLAAMTAVGQLDFVKKYFISKAGKLMSLEDLYMAILWPAACGKPSDYVLFDRDDHLHPKRYVQNAGLDFNRDGIITKAEAAAKVQKKLEKGLLPEFVWVSA
ncbi:transglycosylase SLT domain-containing protein [Methylobacter sp. YRD-M1]|uniref:transglycosylase SLT domain-containing protein n=1 Tax=Methylobacter sp. YRD-M1 TaxID=2911520 RepID=UPI00227CACBE|nr:transglycosylase SLT domain-containing protein [Methylobacter sp. YRD-M1]WAK01353.1 transglycosylase SLT domain-containing protein [Methylobacter sp. YRD-M1]